MLTNEDLDHIEALATASTGGDLQYGELSTAEAMALPAKSAALDGTSADKQWVTWAPPKDESRILAITGNGPTSEANALFFACARQAVLALLADLREMKRRESEVAFRDHYTRLLSNPALREVFNGITAEQAIKAARSSMAQIESGSPGKTREEVQVELKRRREALDALTAESERLGGYDRGKH